MSAPTPTPTSSAGGAGALSSDEAEDYTQLPAALESRLSDLGVDAALRPTKIVLGDTWLRKRQKDLLGAPTSAALGVDEQKDEKKSAFDLLDALSRSGSLRIDCAVLHVIIAVTHCFDDSLIDTVVLRNVNPIEKLELSSLVVASTIQGAPAQQLVRDEQYLRVSTYSAPSLLGAPAYGQAD